MLRQLSTSNVTSLAALFSALFSSDRLQFQDVGALKLPYRRPTVTALLTTSARLEASGFVSSDATWNFAVFSENDELFCDHLIR